jgi:cbb3-type cytochrome oxidase cytochrome c subunit
VLKKLGTPYTDQQIAAAEVDYRTQAAAVVAALATQGKTGCEPDKEIIAMIAYLLRLGRNLEPAAPRVASIEGGK